MTNMPPNPSNYPGGTSDPYFRTDEERYNKQQGLQQGEFTSVGHQSQSSETGSGGLVGLGVILLLVGLIFPPLLPFGILLIAIQMGVLSLAVVAKLLVALLRICIKIIVFILWIPIGIIKVFIPRRR